MDPATLDALTSAPPHLTHRARLAALLMIEPAGSRHIEAGAVNDRSIVMRIEPTPPYDDNVLNLFFAGGEAGAAWTPRLRGSQCWDADWELPTSTSVVTFAAVPEAAVDSCVRQLHRLGRAISFDHSFASYEMPPETWESVVGKDGNSGIPLDLPELNQRLRVPPGFTLDSLVPAEAALLNSHWMYARGEPTEAMLRYCITSLASACIRRCGGEAADGEGADALAGCKRPPCAWVVMRYDGSLGVLHVLEEYRGKGLAAAVMRFAAIQLRRWLHARVQAAAAAATSPSGMMLPASDARHLAAMVVPYCHVADENHASIGVLRSLGMVPVNRVAWVVSPCSSPRFSLRPIRAHDDAEWRQLVQLVNTSYKQDDAAWVDQWRTDAEGTELRAMGKEGVFFVGYRLLHGADASLGIMDDGTISDVLGRGAAPSGAVEDPGKPGTESEELLVAFYIRAPTMPFTSSSSSSLAADSPSLKHNHSHEAAPELSLLGLAAPPTGAVAQLSMLTVLPSLKRMGVAQRLLNAAVELSAAWLHCSALECMVVSVKPWLLAFYLRNGFSVVGTEPWPAFLDHQLIHPCHFHMCRRQLRLK